MKQVTIQLLTLAFVAMLALPATAQPQVVTIREINAIPQANIDQLNALGTGVTSNDINDTGNGLIFNDLLNTEVQFVGVVLSDPLNSGLSNDDDGDGFPQRVHIFVRDTAAVSQGYAGMTIQVVDGNWRTNGTADLTVGDVIRVTGLVDPFLSTQQIPPTTLDLLGRYNDVTNFALPDSILDPVTVTTEDINKAVGGGVALPNWDMLSSLHNQYVRIEGAKVIDRDASSTRPNWTVSSDEGESFASFYDTSIRYRNDRIGAAFYIDNLFNVLEDPFLPPTIGARVNLQGFLTFNGDDPFNRSATTNGDNVLISINPMSDEDLEITEAPPTIVSVSRSKVGPGAPFSAVEVSTEVQPDPSRTVVRVDVKYGYSNGVDVFTENALDQGAGVYTATLPAPTEDGTFLTFVIEAEDSEGSISTSTTQEARFLEAIDSLEDIQLTTSTGFGPSPFAGVKADVNIVATVVSDPAVSGQIFLQDNADLDAWSGILIDNRPEYLSDLALGDVVTITNALIEEEFDVTQLDSVTYTKTGTAEPYAYKVVTTDVLQQDKSIAEAHEGMRLRFENVTITTNDAGFGEWGFSSDGTVPNQIKADDASSAIAPDFAVTTFTNGEVVEYIKGLGWYSFGEFKLFPESSEDISTTATNVANEDETLPGGFALKQNFPNPFNPTTSIAFTVPVSGEVTLQVFDLLGRSVATLLQGPLAAGDHSVAFNAAALPSGTYLYRLTAGSEVSTRVMTLLK